MFHLCKVLGYCAMHNEEEAFVVSIHVIKLAPKVAAVARLEQVTDALGFNAGFVTEEIVSYREVVPSDRDAITVCSSLNCVTERPSLIGVNHQVW